MTEILTEPIIGYRQWKIHPHDWECFDPNEDMDLFPVYFPLSFDGRSLIYKPRQIMQAKCYCAKSYCENYHEVSPAEDSACGIYAYSNINDAFKIPRTHSIVGQLALWGRVEVHKDGYRAEYAYPKAFYRPHYSTLPLLYSTMPASVFKFFVDAWCVESLENPKLTQIYSCDCGHPDCD